LLFGVGFAAAGVGLDHLGRERLVQLLADLQLLLLQATQAGYHDRVFEVARDKGLKLLNVLYAELAHALFE